VASEDPHQVCKRPRAMAPARALCVSLGLGAALVLRSADAKAAELAGAELIVERSVISEDCPDAAALAKSTLALGAPPSKRAAPLRLTVRFDRRADGYVAVIEATGSKQGTRELHHPAATCRPLADATSVVLAVLSDLIPPPQPQPSPPPQPQPSPPPPPQPEPPPPLTLAAGVESGLAYGLLGASLSATAAVALRARYHAAELELGGVWGLPKYELVGPGLLQTNLLAGTAVGCWWFGAKNRINWGGCAGSALGLLRGSGHGFDHDDSATIAWFAAVFGLAAQVPIRSRWSLRLAASGVVPFGSHAFLVSGLESGFRSAPAAFWLRFGPQFRFW
jgi:hypothetical protein